MFTVGNFLTNCYVVGCEKTGEVIIVDPGFETDLESQEVFRFIDANFSTVKLILNTHGHPDHTCGNGMAKERFPAPILVHEYDAYMLGNSSKILPAFFGFRSSSPAANGMLHDGDLIKIGASTLKIAHTPGHSRGSVSLVGDKEVFTGDTLFAGSIGRTDFPESSEADIRNSLKRLADLPRDCIVYPGHGPKTTIGRESDTNPFLQNL